MPVPPDQPLNAGVSRLMKTAIQENWAVNLADGRRSSSCSRRIHSASGS
jgi:hypothetical protein